MSFHQFIPIYESIIGAKCVADDKYYAVQFDFNIVQLPGPGDTFSFSVCCMSVWKTVLGWNYNESFNWKFGCEG